MHNASVTRIELDGIFGQHGFSIRCDWGIEGLEALASTSDVVVVVDTLSFSTAVSVAVERGVLVYPYRFDRESAPGFAESLGALLAVKREDASSLHPYSLSPSSLFTLGNGDRIVLPSLNGSTLCARAIELGSSTILTGTLRNASASARAAQNRGRTISVIAAGERWANGTMRVAIEDYLGAGAILAAFSEDTGFSPEAHACKMLFSSQQRGLKNALEHCASGQELTTLGFSDDVRIAAEYDASSCAALLDIDHFVGVED